MSSDYLMKGASLMNKYYPHLLSPLKIRHKFYKNRMGFPRAVPSIVSGVLCDAPLESMGLYLGGMAKNGAAVVAVNSPTWENPLSRPLPKGVRAPFSDKGFDLNQPNTQLGYCRIIEAIHNYGSLACISLMQIEPIGWTINELTPEVINGMANVFAEKCQIYKDLGFDQCCFYMSYGNSLLAKSLSPIANQRTDKYGGKSMTERATLAHEVFRRVRAACGPDFIIEAQVSGEEPDGGYTVGDLCEFARVCEDVLDVIQVRAADGSLSHPTGINSVEGNPITLRYAEALKKSGTSVIIAPVGGYQDPDLNEMIIAEGKADFIYMARAFICDSEYGKKIAEGRKEDIVPCVLCNACHMRPNNPDAGCVVNPRVVLSLDHNYRVEPPTDVRRVAVIGGGPAGMEAALVAAQRGHRVTLYEKAEVLGGQLRHADYCSFKWPLRNFKNYLINQVRKSNIDVRLGVEATPDLLKGERYDAIILAAGGKHKFPNIPGVEGKNVWNPLAVYGHETELGKKVVVIGGSMTGVETGLYLAMNGHDVTVLTRQERLAHDAQPVHFREIFEEKWKAMGNFTGITKAHTTAIGKGSVTYTDVDGKSQTIAADSVVACGGLDSCQDGALEFAGITDYFRLIGDCRSVGDVRTAMKSAYTAASAL
jgi:2,4-dienoyl-CoA reductase-like NADH-dependent reductase (Old Yellow Enzyme family)/thioredoxin reductase